MSLWVDFKATRKGGYWLAQANVIARVKQGSDWQSLTNGQLFTNRDQFGCFYHDNVIFAYIVKILWISWSVDDLFYSFHYDNQSISYNTS